MSAQHMKIRRMVLTGAITAITAMGAWYGAGLKTEQQQNSVATKRVEATVAERVALLEEQKGALLAKKIGLERKLAEIQARDKGATWEESRVGRERKR